MAISYALLPFEIIEGCANSINVLRTLIYVMSTLISSTRFPFFGLNLLTLVAIEILNLVQKGPTLQEIALLCVLVIVVAGCKVYIETLVAIIKRFKVQTILKIEQENNEEA